jgi:hypothetical protein
VRTALYALAAAIGAFLALLGSEPSWILAIAALLAVPLAATAALRRRREGEAGPLVPLLAAALAGGLLTALAFRLAFDADGWLNPGAVDCGGVSQSTQDGILTLAAALFAAAAAAMAFNLLAVLRRSGPRRDEEVASAPLTLYPVAVAASGLALVGASFATSC